MSTELAHLVESRAPLTGYPYRVLLHLALGANECDVVHATGRSMAMKTRGSLHRCFAALRQLEADGWVDRLRFAVPKDARNGYFLVRRDRLAGLPRLDLQAKQSVGMPIDQLDARASATLTKRVAENTALLTAWMRPGIDSRAREALLRSVAKPDSRHPRK